MSNRQSCAGAPALLLGFVFISPCWAQPADVQFDAAVVAFPSNTAIRILPDLDGDGRVEAVGAWFRSSGLTISAYSFAPDGTPQELWSFTSNFGSTGGFADMATADFDGDGRGDIAILYGSQLQVYLARGSTLPLRTHVQSLSSGPVKVVSGDFTGDGSPDLATLEVSNGLTVRIHANNGGTFIPAGTHLMSSGNSSDHFLTSTEIDGNATNDLIVATGSLVHLIAVRPGGNPVRHSSMILPGVNLMPCSGDIDGDGDTDIVAFDIGSIYSVLRRTGPQTFTLEAQRSGGPATDLADIDGDGDLDGVCCGGGGGGSPSPNNHASLFEVALNAGDGTFARAFAIAGLGSRRLAGVVDLDGDGDKEMIAGRAVYFARGPIERSPEVATPASPGAAGLIDFDRDGDPDVLGTFWSWHRNTGEGTFPTTPAPLMPGAPAGTRWSGPGFAGDFDGDGDHDLIVAQVQGPQFTPQHLGMRLLRNAGGGEFVDGGPAAPAGIDFNASQAQGDRNQTTLARTADLDGDGDLDLVVNSGLQTQPAATRAWRNNGSGTFTAGFTWSNATVQAIVDLDGDGTVDAITVESYYASGDAVVAVRRGLGNGAFAAPVALPNTFASHQDRLGTIDWDNDGDLDIVGGRTDAWTLSVCINNGNLAFTGLSNLPFIGRDGPRAVDLADFDADGRAELLTTPFDGANVAALWRRGTNGSFQRPEMVQTMTPTGVTDMDGDGDPDVAVWRSWVRNMRFAGNGAGGRRQYGTPAACSGGMSPTMGTTGPFRAGHLAETIVTGAVGGGVGLYVLGTSPVDLPDTPIPGVTLHVMPAVIVPFALSGTPGAPGEGSTRLPYMVTPDFAGVTLYKQMYVFDPWLPQSWCASNGLAVTYGR